MQGAQEIFRCQYHGSHSEVCYVCRSGCAPLHWSNGDGTGKRVCDGCSTALSRVLALEGALSWAYRDLRVILAHKPCRDVPELSAHVEHLLEHTEHDEILRRLRRGS